jgi:hypothetical protein
MVKYLYDSIGYSCIRNEFQHLEIMYSIYTIEILILILKTPVKDEQQKTI